MAIDHYRTLGVARDASTDEIRRAFRRLARETHPDANPGDPGAEQRFRDVATAYEVLSDPDRRRRYDRGETFDVADLFSGFGFDDILRSVFGDAGMFGGGVARHGPGRGRDIIARVEIELREAAFGTEADVAFRAASRCDSCAGAGTRKGASPARCSTCGGAGAVRVARRGLLGNVMSVIACDTCSGTGEMIMDPCSVCAGRGAVARDRSVRVEVPAGVETGTRLRLSREGEAGPRGGDAGDLYVEVLVKEHPDFIRDGDNLVHRTSIGIAEAALGTEILVPTVDGDAVAVGVPAGTQPGTIQQITGLGMGRLGRRGRGDMHLRIDVEIPTAMTDEQQDLLRRFGALNGPPPSERRRRRGL